jgi:hypothetical protein
LVEVGIEKKKESRTMSKLVYVSMDSNNIGDEGAAIIAQALQNNTSLTYLE